MRRPLGTSQNKSSMDGILHVEYHTMLPSPVSAEPIYYKPSPSIVSAEAERLPCKLNHVSARVITKALALCLSAAGG